MTAMIDPIFCLESLERFEPEAAFTLTMRSNQDVPCSSLHASMRNTGNAVFKGYGAWVRMDDVLRLMIALKKEQAKV